MLYLDKDVLKKQIEMLEKGQLNTQEIESLISFLKLIYKTADRAMDLYKTYTISITVTDDSMEDTIA